MSDDDPIGGTIVQRLGRATLPLERPGESGTAGTAFFYNHLLESTPAGDSVIECLVTADALTQGAVGSLCIRPEMVDPRHAASDVLMMSNFDQQWMRDARSGVAFMDSQGLHEHGQRKQWSWVLQQVTEGWAAKEDHVEAVGTQPELGYLLGHSVEGRKRPLMLVRGTVARDTASGSVIWSAEAPEGFTGAPVFSTRPVGGGSVSIICLGVLLPGSSKPKIATFDAIRTAIAEVIR